MCKPSNLTKTAIRSIVRLALTRYYSAFKVLKEFKCLIMSREVPQVVSALDNIVFTRVQRATLWLMIIVTFVCRGKGFWTSVVNLCKLVVEYFDEKLISTVSTVSATANMILTKRKEIFHSKITWKIWNALNWNFLIWSIDPGSYSRKLKLTVLL